MDKVKIIEAKESLLADNDKDADRLRVEMKQQGTYYVNLMSSPGSGKTSSLKQIIARMKDRFRIGVMEADIDSDVDARTIAASGVDAIQIHTGGMCHLDADMSRQGLSAIGSEKLDLVFLENVGNLVCPAEFDTGADLNVVILSVPEGDDSTRSMRWSASTSAWISCRQTSSSGSQPFRSFLSVLQPEKGLRPSAAGCPVRYRRKRRAQNSHEQGSCNRCPYGHL